MIRRRTFLGAAAAATVRGADRSAERLTVSEASARIRGRKMSPVEITRACLERIDRLNPRLNAVITPMRESALNEANRLEAEVRNGKWRGPLHGVPVGLKDLYDTAGVRTTAGSRHWADRVPKEDAESVRRLKAAGAIIVAKLNMDEFAYNFTGETSAFGTSRNPWNPDRSPGGSSGGSAVAVAAGMCLASLGSDTGGSIRLPAAFCGITGFKPTYGIISTEGAAPLAWSLDHVGPMCLTARDAALMHEVLSGRPLQLSSVNVKTLRLGVPKRLFYDGVDPEVQKAVAEAAGVLTRLTSGVREVTLPALAMSDAIPFFPDAYVKVISAESWAFHEQMIRQHPERYHDGTRKTVEGGREVTAAQYIQARRALDRLRASAGEFFRDADLLLTPTAPMPAFEFGKGDLVALRNSAPWNLLGAPSVSVPCGFTRSGLPVGLQITGKPGADAQVLALAAAYQDATDWHMRRPPLN